MTAQKFAPPDLDGPKREAEERGALFVRMEDLIGRHIIVVPSKIETKEGTNPAFSNPTFEQITADIIILDGRKTEKITALPRIERDFWITGFNVIAELRVYCPGGKRSGEPAIGYLTMAGKAYRLDKADSDVLGPDGTLAPKFQPAWDQYVNGLSQPQDTKPPF